MNRFLAIGALICAANMGAAQSRDILETQQEAEAFYIEMMRQNGCEMTATDISDAMEAAFPYNNEVTRESQMMLVDVAIDFVDQGLIVRGDNEIGYGATVKYIGPDGC